MQQVRTTRTLADAYLTMHLLQEAGIAAEVRNEQLVGTDGLVPATAEMRPQVWVSDAEVDDARRVVAEAAAAPAPSWDDDGDDRDGGDGVEVAEAMAELHRAARGLARDPRRGTDVDAVVAAASLFGGAPPFGVEPRTWTSVALLVQRIATAAETGDDEVVQAAAVEVRDLLAPLVGAG